MNLKPQDVVILLKLLILDSEMPSYAILGRSLHMSASEVHSGVRRLVRAKLINPNTNQPFRKAAEEFLLHGVKYAFPPRKGALTIGVPTAYAAPPLNSLINKGNDPPPVWPSPDGKASGMEFSPLYRTVPQAAQADSRLYEMLALVDALRDGRKREQELASKELSLRIAKHG